MENSQWAYKENNIISGKLETVEQIENSYKGETYKFLYVTKFDFREKNFLELFLIDLFLLLAMS